MKHIFTSTKTQGSDPSLVGPNQWNDTHGYGLTLVSVNTVITSAMDVILATSGGSGITITLPSASTNTNRSFIIKKIDSSVQAVNINTTGGQTIDGNASGYVLVNQWQYVEVLSDGSNWQIIRNN